MAIKLHGNGLLCKNLIDTIGQLGYIERDGRRYSVVALTALLRVVSVDPEKLAARTSWRNRNRRKHYAKQGARQHELN